MADIISNDHQRHTASESSDPVMSTSPCPNHGVHAHTFPELSLTTSSNRQRYFRAMIFFNKKPGLTDEFFHSHWRSVHADLTMQVPGAGVDLVRYAQFHQEKKDVEAMSELLEASGGSMTMMGYDGAAEFWAESAEDFTRFMKSVYGSKHLVGCGTRFVDLVQGYHVMVGYDNLIMGAAVPGMGGNGILSGDSRLTASIMPEVKKNEDVHVEQARECHVNINRAEDKINVENVTCAT